MRGWFAVHAAPFGDLVLAQVREVTRERQLPDLVALAGISGDAVMSVGRDRRLRLWNRAAEQMYGWPEREVLGRSPTLLSPPEERERQASAIAAALAGDDVAPFRTVRRRRDGSTFPCEVTVAPVLDPSGRVVSTLSVHRDVSAEVALRDASPVAIVSLDADRRVTAWNPAAERILGWSEAEVLHRPFPAVAPADLDLFRSRGRAQLDGPTEAEVRYRHRDGHEVVARLTTNPLRAPDGHPVGVVGLIEDLTQHHHVELERTERRVVAGALAGVRLGATVERTAGDLCAVATAIEDFDGAVLLRAAGGEVELLGRQLTPALEQLVVVPPPGAAQVVDALAAQGPWATRFDASDWGPGPVVDVLAAAGVTFLVGAPVVWEGRTIAQLVGCSTRVGAADHAEGRLALFAEVANHAAVLLGPQLAAADELAATKARIAGVIGSRRFRPVYQPVVDLASGATVGFEALTRFDDGSPPPAVFRDAAGAGLGHDLERAALEVAIEHADRLGDGWLSLNVSPGTVLSGLAGLLAGSRGRPLVLEVTEHVAVADYGDLARALAGIPGVRVAVDDAGAGYASLRHILELRPHLVKLDMGLVRGIDADPARQALVAGMAHFAAETGTELLAEGVETAAEAATVQRLGVGLAQGHLFGRPAPPPQG